MRHPVDFFLCAFSSLFLLHTGDSRVEKVRDDPRLQKNAAPIVVGGKARNTDSFDPESTFVRPEMRSYSVRHSAPLRALV